MEFNYVDFKDLVGDEIDIPNKPVRMPLNPCNLEVVGTIFGNQIREKTTMLTNPRIQLEEFLDNDSHTDIKTNNNCDGADTIAFYAPYHLHGRNFGIYFIKNTFNSVVQNIIVKYNCTKKDAVYQAYGFVSEHELFHFKTEYVVTLMENYASHTPLDWDSCPYRRLYLENYTKRCLEEKLADAAACKLTVWLKFGRLELAGKGGICYMGYKDYIRDKQFNEGLRDLMNWDAKDKLVSRFANNFAPLISYKGKYIRDSVPQYLIG